MTVLRSSLPVAVALSLSLASPPVAQEQDTQPVNQNEETHVELLLGLPEDIETAAVILAAEDQRDLTIHLLQLTGDEDAAVRARAALAVGRIGLPSGMDTLLAMCSDPDPGVRALAAFGVGLIELDIVPAEEAATLRRRAATVLVGLIGDPGVEVAAQSIWALGRLADAVAEEPLRDILERAEAVPVRLVTASLSAWWRLPGVTPDPALVLLGSPDPGIRLAAAHAVRRLNDPNARPALLELLGDPDPNVRAMALRGLREAPANVADAQAVRLLSDDDWRVVAEALAWLETAWGSDWNPQDDSVYAVIRASMEHNVHLRRRALAALANVALEWPVAKDVLVQAMRDPEPSVRAACLEGFAAAGREAARAALPTVAELYRGSSRVVAGTDSLEEESLEELQPVEAIALVRLLATAEDERSMAWLELLGSEGPLAAQIETLQHWRQLDAQWAAQRVAWLLRSADPLLRGNAAEVAPSLHAAGIAVPDAEGSEGWIDLLWQAHLDLQDSGNLGPYLQVLGAIRDLDDEVFESRASIFYGSADRVARLWTYRTLEGHIGHGEMRRPLPESMEVQVRGPQQTGRTDDDYRALAGELLRLQAQPPRLVVQTRRGEFELELEPHLAPLTVIAYTSLINRGFFDGVRFHRVIPGFVAQVGDPTSTGYGSAPITLRNEESPEPYRRGTVGLALSGRDTGSSQLFVAHAPQPHLDGIYPVFGRVLRGQRALERIQPGDAILRMK